MITTYISFDAAAYPDNGEIIAEYISTAIEDANPDVFLAALGDVARDAGLGRLALTALRGRQSFPKSAKDGQ